MVAQRKRMAGRAGQSLAARVLLCVALILQLVAFPVCRAAASGSAASAELVALGKALGQPIVLCHAGTTDGQGDDKRADHHCCDCGLCGAADLAPPRPDALGLVVPVEAGAKHLVSRFAWIAARVPSVVATSPRGAPVLV